jgi:tetratricopeptide (TPR) repeat protein
LTYTLAKLSPQQWNIAVKRLSEVDLLSVSADAIDAHPLIREYFAVQLKRDQPEAFRQAHSRLFDYLCMNTPYWPEGLDGLAPLYEAVTHGCLAGRHQEALEKVYHDRILRGTGVDGQYSTRELGAFGADLAALAAFFDEPWSKVSPNLTEAAHAWLLSTAAFCMRALGRLSEALQLMRAGLNMAVLQSDRKNAAVYASNLSELEVTLGRLQDAKSDARESITHADQSGDAFERMAKRTTAADALHQSGDRAQAGELFAEAERMQQQRNPQYELLSSLGGFRYCDWLLAPAERAAWITVFSPGLRPEQAPQSQNTHASILAEVEHRATSTLRWMIDRKSNLLSIALDHLTLARVNLIRAILSSPLPQATLELQNVAAAVNDFRAAGSMNHLPRGLLTAALYHFVRGEHALAEKHLAEAQQIAQRGPMPLFQADVHLARARFRGRLKSEEMSFKREVVNWNVDPQSELANAAKLIRDIGYGRRYDELADAEAAAKDW